MPEKLNIISVPVHLLSFSNCLKIASGWAIERKPSYICFANAHMTIEAHRNIIFKQQISQADLVLADGKPLSMACKLLYHQSQERICGMDFLPCILKVAEEKRLSVFLYGSTDKVLKGVKNRIRRDFPKVNITGMISPPFFQLTKEELEKNIRQINTSGANLVLVSLGCPKQERWMAENSANINSVLLGIGGALPVFAGIQKRAPVWMQNLSLEWLYRVYQQPNLLFTRYIYTNSYFLWLLGKAWIKSLLKQGKMNKKNYGTNHAGVN